MKKIDIIVAMDGRENIMNDEHIIISSRQTSNYLSYPFFKRKRRISLYRDMFLQDFCMHFSIILRKKNDFRCFYKIDGPDNRLLNLLEYDNGMFLEYDIDKLLAGNLSDLLHYGKSHVELVKIFDKDKNLIGIKLIRFRNNLQVHIGKKIYYILRTYDGKIVTGKIDAENVISFKLRDIGYSKSYFRKLFRKLYKYDSNFLKLSMDSKSGFEMDVYERKQDCEFLKLGHNVRWLGRKYDNYYVNEPYLLYIKMEEMKLKEEMLSKLLSKYNEKIAQVGKKYGFLGEICFDTKTSNYSDLYKALMKGMKNCEEVSDEIY